MTKMYINFHKKHRIEKGIFYLSIFIIFSIVIASCKKETYVNPYNDKSLKAPEGGTQTGAELDGFAWLHERIFQPTCANSGCHDGNFEPDFRTIYSSYQSLVYQPVISNDASHSFTFRVLPGNAAMSMIHERLSVFIPNSSGIMPLATNKDWNLNKALYIQKITDWINAGAKDMFGKVPGFGNMEPMITGMLVFPSGNTSLPNIGPAPFSVPLGSSVDLWFSVSDDSTSAHDMSINQIKFSTKPFNFNAVSPQNMQIASSPINGKDFYGNSVAFTHMASFNAGIYPPGTIIYIRTYIRDASHASPAESPADGSNEVIRNMFTLKIVP